MSKITKTGFNINITKLNIFDIIYLILFLYKCRFKAKIVISKPNIIHKKPRLINDNINKVLLIYFQVITGK